MFIVNTKKGSGWLNALILITILVVVICVVLSFVKLKKDPKNPDGYITTLGLSSKKKAA